MRRPLIACCTALVALAPLAPAAATAAPVAPPSPAAARAEGAPAPGDAAGALAALASWLPAGLLPDRIPLPIGFQPEGIAIDPLGIGYVGSISTGAVYRFWAVTGQGEVLVPPAEGRAAIGTAIRGGRLFVAGGATGQAYVYDRFTGDALAAYQLADPGVEGGTFVNDVTVTDEAAWFTDSRQPVLYRVPVAPGDPDAPDGPEALPLTGDLQYQEGFNLNGIAATPDGEALVVAQSNTGRLFLVDAATGATTAVAVTDEAGQDVALTNADGILLDDGRLWVVRNQRNEIVELALGDDLLTATVVDTVTDPRFDVPTTVDRFLGRLYAVNARFGTDDPASAEYAVVAVQP